jgi:hypothetical protein
MPTPYFSVNDRRGTPGMNAIEDQRLISTRGLPHSLLYWDSNTPEFGILRKQGSSQFAAEAEMLAIFIDTKDHRPSGGFTPFNGACADFSMGDLSTRETAIFAMMVMSNGNEIPAAQIALLREWGLWNDGFTPARALASTDKLAFVGRYGMEQGSTAEIRVTSGDLICACHLIGKAILQ